MSQENVKRHRRLAETFSAGEIEAFIAYCDPRIEFHTEFAEVAGCYQGHDGLRKFFRDYEDVWGEEIRIEPEAYFDLGEHTLLFIVVRGRGRHSGLEVVMASAHLARWRDGLLIYFKAYADREDALRDLGVSQDALESARAVKE